MINLQKIFKVDTAEKPLMKIIFWWEIRRILYNLFLIFFLFFTFTIISFLPRDGFIIFYASPMLVAGISLGLFLFFIVANICYTGGWIFQIATRKLNWKVIQVLTGRLFIYELILSFIVTLLPIILWMLNVTLPERILKPIYLWFINVLSFVNLI